MPTAATCGSVKTTRGEPAASARAGAGSRPRIRSEAIRAWYLPMCVSSARPLTSPIAYSHPSLAPSASMKSSTST